MNEMNETPIEILTRTLALGRGADHSTVHGGLGPQTRAAGELLYLPNGNPWLGFIDLRSCPLEAFWFEMLATWLMTLSKTMLKPKGLLVAKPVLPGHGFVRDFKHLGKMPDAWPRVDETAVLVLCAGWSRRGGGNERPPFYEIRKFALPSLNHHERGDLLWGRTFDGYTALLLAYLSTPAGMSEVKKGLDAGEGELLESLLPNAILNFTTGLVGGFDLASKVNFPTEHLKNMKDARSRLKYTTRYFMNGSHKGEEPCRPIASHSGAGAWVESRFVPAPLTAAVPEAFRQAIKADEFMMMDSEVELAWQAELAMRSGD